jgi:ABC-type nitrate/sulfonate/bicarbonate transport system substrate-binding protein
MVRMADHREVLPDYPGGVYAVSRSWAMENRPLLVRFLRAWIKVLDWCHEEKNCDEAAKSIAAAEKLDEKAAVNRLRQLPENGQLNLPGLKCVLDLRVLFKLTPPMGQEIRAYYDENFYAEASN